MGWEVTVAVSATGGGVGGGCRWWWWCWSQLPATGGGGGVVLSRNIAAVQWVLPPVNFMLKCVS